MKKILPILLIIMLAACHSAKKRALTNNPDYNTSSKTYMYTIRETGDTIFHLGNVYPRDIIRHVEGRHVLVVQGVVTQNYYSKKGKMDGPYISYSTTGQPAFKGYYHKGLRIGLWLEYNYADPAKKIGQWIYYDGKGNITKTEDCIVK